MLPECSWRHALLLFVTLVSAMTSTPKQVAGAVVCVRLRVPEGTDGLPQASRCRVYAECQHRFERAFSGDEPQASASSGLEVRYRFRYSPVLVLARVESGLRRKLERSPHVAALADDQQGGVQLAESAALIGADRVRMESGLTGDGRTVALVDTGIDRDHPDLEAAVLHEHHFLDQGSDVGPGAPDEHGHGTHIAGILASRGHIAPPGIASRSRIVVLRALDALGRGYVSDWTAAIEHAVDLHRSPGGPRIDAINLSVGTDGVFRSACDETFRALASACEAAREHGILVVAASGNDGSPDSVVSPACLSPVLTVGAVEIGAPGRITRRTNRGSLLDLLAPGRSIRSCGLRGTIRSESGTSQAVPHVVATHLLLRELSPTVSVEQVEQLLRETGVPVTDAISGAVVARLDAHSAVARLNDAVCPGANCAQPVNFRRGDTNGDGVVDIADAVTLLAFVFLKSSGLGCPDASDTDDDGRIETTDAVVSLRFLFLGGLAPRAPGPWNCGGDPSDDALGPCHVECSHEPPR